MNRDQKSAVVDEIAGQLQAAEAIFAVDYRGISVAQVAELRSKLRDADATFRIVKNSLTERAADKAGADALKPLLEGPTALALVQGDAALAAKALNDTARALNNILEFKGGLLNGNALSADDVRSIARLPSRDVLNAQLVGAIASPLTGLVRTLNALIAGLAIQLQAIADQGLVSGQSSEGASSDETATQVSSDETPSAQLVPDTADEPEPGAAEEVAAEAEPGAADELAAEPGAAEELAAEPEPEQAEQPDEEAASDAAPSDE
jgi:large subunit ribosomal protein L10